MNTLFISVFILVLAVIIYFANKPSSVGNCLAGKVDVCTDDWGTVNAVKQCGTDGKYIQGVGPDGCQVSCPTGTVPCWNASTKKGSCISSTASCPCNTSSDCLNGGTCDPSKSVNCICPKGFTGARCEIKQGGCDNCGPGGSCVNGSCVCNDGWQQAAPDGSNLQCSVCLSGRGPLGSCKGVLVKNSGIGIPLPTTNANCYNGDDSTSTLTAACVNEFGTASGAVYQSYCSNNTGHNACRSDKSKTPIGKLNTNSILCSLPNGFFIDKNYINQLGSYVSCNDNGSNGTTLRPTGWLGANYSV
jgi:hypothetical protein